jgi:hypothetical protein
MVSGFANNAALCILIQTRDGSDSYRHPLLYEPRNLREQTLQLQERYLVTGLRFGGFTHSLTTGLRDCLVCFSASPPLSLSLSL